MNGLRPFRRPALHLALAVAAALFLLPVLVMIATALQESGGGSVSIIPTSFTLDNLRDVWNTTGLPRLFLNSVIVTAASSLLALGLGSLAAFGIVRYRFRFANVVMVVIVLGITLPPVAIIVPLYDELRGFGLLNNYLGLIGPYTALGLPVAVLLFRNAFESIPRELGEASRIDGASALTSYWRVFMPLSMPTIAAVLIIETLFIWNEFLLALLVMVEPKVQTAQLAYVAFAGQFSVQFEKQFAVLALVSIPIIVLFVLFQRQFVKGLTTGAVKG